MTREAVQGEATKKAFDRTRWRKYCPVGRPEHSLPTIDDASRVTPARRRWVRRCPARIVSRRPRRRTRDAPSWRRHSRPLWTRRPRSRGGRCAAAIPACSTPQRSQRELHAGIPAIGQTESHPRPAPTMRPTGSRTETAATTLSGLWTSRCIQATAAGASPRTFGTVDWPSDRVRFEHLEGEPARLWDAFAWQPRERVEAANINTVSDLFGSAQKRPPASPRHRRVDRVAEEGVPGYDDRVPPWIPRPGVEMYWEPGARGAPGGSRSFILPVGYYEHRLRDPYTGHPGDSTFLEYVSSATYSLRRASRSEAPDHDRPGSEGFRRSNRAAATEGTGEGSERLKSTRGIQRLHGGHRRSFTDSRNDSGTRKGAFLSPRSR